MDITVSSNKIYTNKLFNGETVNYLVFNSIAFFVMIVIKQIFKTFIGISTPVSVVIAFAVAMILSYFFEKRFVFIKNVKNTTVKQILWYVFRCGVNFGFYKISEFVFNGILEMSYAFVWGITFLMLLFFNYQFDKLVVFNSNHDPVKRTNGRLYNKLFNNRFVIASMACSLLCFGFIFIIFQLFPFGDTTVLRMDLYHQYGPLFVELFDRVVEGKSFLYSWQSGGGSSFLGNYFNYLSSPLSAIIFLFDRKDMAYAITTLVAVKGILSAGTFTYFIKKSLNRHSYSSAAFGMLYGFCGYFLAYYWNVMWLDGMILLPLIALGIENIINKGKPTLYIVTLALMFYSSYYISYMVCIFAILYFLVYFFTNYSGGAKIDNNLIVSNKHSVKNLMNNTFFNRGVNFAVSSILTAMLCAVVLIPVYFILQACSATSDNFPVNFESYFDIFNFLSSHLAGLETTIRSSGDDVLPNVYCGILTCLLVPVYVANKKIRIKEKSLYIALLLVFLFCFNNNCMNFIMHALHFPNDLPYRFSFMYSFVLLIIAYKALIHIKALQYKDIAMIGMAWIFVVLLFQKFPTNKIEEATIYISIAFIIVWTAVLLLVRKGMLDKMILGITILSVALCEIVVADSNSFIFNQSKSSYTYWYDSYEDAIEYTHNQDDDFYRTELCYLNTRMDPCLYGYNGMSTFSSMAYENYSGSQYALGMFGNRINSYTYNTQTPVYNMMYNLKYLMYYDTGSEPSTEFYTPFYMTDDMNTVVYENDYFLPIAFTTSSDINDWDNAEGNPFDVQSDFIYKATGINNVFEEVEYLTTSTTDVDCETVLSNGTYFFSKFDTASQYGTVDINIKTVNDSNLYVYITSPEVENVNYYWDDGEKSQYQNINEPYIIDLGKHNTGDEITVSIDVGSSDAGDSYFEIYAYNVNKDAFVSAYELLKIGAIDIEKHSDTSIKGTINAGYDGTIYTSIPYDEGWSVYIDGEKVETYSIGECQLVADISEGKHSIELKYTPKGFVIGGIASGVAFLLLIGWLTLNKKGYLLKLNKKKKN